MTLFKTSVCTMYPPPHTLLCKPIISFKTGMTLRIVSYNRLAKYFLLLITCSIVPNNGGLLYVTAMLNWLMSERLCYGEGFTISIIPRELKISMKVCQFVGVDICSFDKSCGFDLVCWSAIKFVETPFIPVKVPLYGRIGYAS